MPFLQRFKKCYCLCLDKRANQWDELENQVTSLGGRFEKFIVGRGKELPHDKYDMIDDPNPDLSGWNHNYSLNGFYCHASQRSMLQNIQKEGYSPDDEILFMEDDAEFLDGFEDVAQKAQEDMDRLNISHDLLYLSSNMSWGKTEIITDNLIKLESGNYCFHATSFKVSMIDHLLALPKNAPFDYLTSIYTQPKYKCYTLFPAKIIQRSGYSSVNGQIEDYSGYFTNKGNHS